jgi:hypothetical protein
MNATQSAKQRGAPGEVGLVADNDGPPVAGLPVAPPAARRGHL